ncbi:MAG: RDD family protein [Acidobacteriaceae bacterium]|nr:RDD family protein [Acidobacteriaceae bacterium]
MDDDHRCRRCGRRVRTSPSRISAQTYPIAATASAPAYDFPPEADTTPTSEPAPVPQTAQQPLFVAVQEPRVIPFDSLTTPAERESIRARAAEASRPAPVRNAKVELRHARGKRCQAKEQRRLDFFGHQEVLTQPQSHIICDAPVAPPALRVEAALVDTLIMACGCLFILASYFYEAGHMLPLPAKHVLPFLLAALATVPLFYKLLWTFAGLDSIGMRAVGLRLVDFDGNPPSQERRYYRAFGGIISVLAAGVGLIWALVDEDGLTWHDHMSTTFPTVISES